MGLTAVELLERATERMRLVMAGVTSDRLTGATPCQEWDVQDLMDHIAGGPAYLLAGMGAAPPGASRVTAVEYEAALDRCLAALREPAALDRRCVSPLGFEWSVAEAAAGTFMDQLVHTWDLAAATGQDAALDPELVEACLAMFFPAMPEHGRAAGLVGPAVDVQADAPAQDRLLAGMGRRP
jgi:uncharacterized protein (TIGR03086 family)